MKRLKMFVCLLALMNSFLLKAQSADTCISSNHVCFNEGALMYSTDVGSGNFGNNVACLYNSPNPHWFCFQVLQPGRLNISLSSTSEHDLDFVCWGPFSADNYNELIGSGVCAQLNLDSAGCVSHGPDAGANPMDLGGYPVGNIVDCGYSTSATEYIHIPNMVANEWYMIMVTNYSNQPGTIMMAAEPSSTGSTNCIINQPILTASTDSLSDFTYFDNHGPSSSQMFTVEGNYLIPNDLYEVFIVASDNYEVSFNPDFDYSDTIIIYNYGSSIPQTQIYVRLKDCLSIGDDFSGLITISGGGADSVTINCHGSVVVDNGIEESGEFNCVTISPNPSSDLLNCTFETKTNRTLSIVDIAGKTIVIWESNLQKETIDVKSLSNGVYFLKVKENGNQYTSKFVIRKD